MRTQDQPAPRKENEGSRGLLPTIRMYPCVTTGEPGGSPHRVWPEAFCGRRLWLWGLRAKGESTSSDKSTSYTFKVYHHPSDTLVTDKYLEDKSLDRQDVKGQEGGTPKGT